MKGRIGEIAPSILGDVEEKVVHPKKLIYILNHIVYLDSPQANANHMAELRDYKRLQLGIKGVVFLFGYYAIISAASFYYTICFLKLFSGDAQSLLPLYVAISMSALGSSIFYSRKLYKACIDDSYSFKPENGASFQYVGTFMFFLLRPIFAIGLSMCSFFVWKVALLASLETPSKFSDSHIYISGALGFFAGFLAGRLIDRFEETGMQEMDRLRGGQK
ncbi:hypothetical protein [Mesorhizobium sp. M0586]|uniref:hypothetical protein n=1 Tax=unclassified Mesorhizobium TaxID=325217 RepID=UPI0033375642